MHVIKFPWRRSLRMRLFYNRRFRRILFGTLVLVIFVFSLIFIVVPFVFRYSYSLQRSLLFLNFVNNRTNLRIPSKHEMLGTRNVYIESQDNVQLGAWHVLPSSKLPDIALQSIINPSRTDEIYDRHFSSGEPVILYLHGNAGNRAAKHRIELYKLLQNNNYHVVAPDYRSYGDSSPVPADEMGVVTDAKAVYAWIKKHAPRSNIFIWGHSLGTGISSHTLMDLEAEGSNPSGLILEAPFTNLQDEIRDYPMSKVFRPLPWFDFFFVTPTYENNLRFSSDIYLKNVSAPILILHAEDDSVVPYHLGRKLYEEIKAYRGEDHENTIQFVGFTRKLGFGHQFIVKDRSLPQTISNFVKMFAKKKN